MILFTHTNWKPIKPNCRSAVQYYDQIVDEEDQEQSGVENDDEDTAAFTQELNDIFD